MSRHSEYSTLSRITHMYGATENAGVESAARA